MLKMLHLEWSPISFIEKDKPRMMKGNLINGNDRDYEERLSFIGDKYRLETID